MQSDKKRTADIRGFNLFSALKLHQSSSLPFKQFTTQWTNARFINTYGTIRYKQIRKNARKQEIHTRTTEIKQTGLNGQLT